LIYIKVITWSQLFPIVSSSFTVFSFLYVIFLIPWWQLQQASIDAVPYSLSNKENKMKNINQCRKLTQQLSLLLILIIGLFHSALFASELSKTEKLTTEKKILIVVSSDSHGYWLPEVVEPYRIFVKAGFAIDIASPKGGEGRAGGRLSSEDRTWYQQSSLPEELANAKALSEVQSWQYQAVYFAGGSGPMFDLVDNKQAQRITREIYENNGFVSADCHGPVALLNVKLSDGERLIHGKKLTAKANVEEGRWARSNYPFLLEDKIAELGGYYSSAGKSQKHVVVDGRLITGQNPASAIPMAEALISHLSR